MDYDFYTLDIAKIPDSLREQLLIEASIQHNNPNSKNYFTDGVNPGFKSSSIETPYDNERPVIKEAINLLSDFFNSNQYTSCEVNILQTHGRINEHTDQSSAVTPTGINYGYGVYVSSWHSIHIPLTGYGEYLFRRDNRNNHDIVHMKPGSMYVFNNHVMHSVNNISNETRINMILHFHDPRWLSKRKLYEHYKIKGIY